MTACLIVAVLLTSIAIGAQHARAHADKHKTQLGVGEVQALVHCRTSAQYPDLSDFSFVPRSVPREDTACLALIMFREMGFIDHFNISVDTLSRFILRVQRGYRDVPYHNWPHGFEVLQFSFAVLKNCRLIEKHHLKPLEGLALLTAAMCHDIDHPGTNNQFQVEINSALAQRYGDQGSILERHHIAVTLGLLRNTETNFMAHLDERKITAFENTIRKIILATDLSVHFQLLPEEKEMASAGFDKQSERHRELLRAVIISCADLSSTARGWTSVPAAAKLLFMEFFGQGDRESQLGLVPNKMMDRHQADIPQIQVDFFTHVVIPNYQVLLSLYPETQTCADNLQQNLANWRKAVSYFKDQERQGRKQMDILSDKRLENIST